MAERGRVLATKPDDPNLIPGVAMVEGENRLLRAVFQAPCVCFDTLLSTLKCKIDE